MQFEGLDSGKSHSLSGQSLATVADQLTADLNAYLSGFRSESFALRLLSQKTEVSVKTLRRLRAGQNKPSYPTLFRIYFYLLSADSESDLLTKAPAVVAKELEGRATPAVGVKMPQSYFDFHQMVSEQPLIAELYVWATLEDLHRNSVVKRYGSYGMELVDEMIRKDLLRAVNKNVFTPSPNAPVFDSKTIKVVGSHFVRRFADPARSSERGQNALAFFAERLNREGLNEWLKIDEAAFYKKMEVAKATEYQGDEAVFTFCVTDRAFDEWEV